MMTDEDFDDDVLLEENKFRNKGHVWDFQRNLSKVEADQYERSKSDRGLVCHSCIILARCFRSDYKFGFHRQIAGNKSKSFGIKKIHFQCKNHKHGCKFKRS